MNLFKSSNSKKNYVPFLHRRRKIRRYSEPTFYSHKGVAGIHMKRKDYIHEKGPLNESKFCKLVGYTPNYVGYAPSKRKPVNNDFLKFMSSEVNIDEMDMNEFLSKRREVWTGGYDTFRYVLNEFTKERETKATAQDYLRILEEEGFPWLKLPKMPALKDTDFDILSINPDAHPGFFTKLFFGDTRKNTVKYSLDVAKYIFNHLKKKRFKWEGLWCLGGRSKDVKLSDEYTEKISTRAVWIPEEPLVLLSLLVVQPFTKCLQAIERNCIFVGKNFSIKENQWIQRLENLFPWSMRCDWTLFDAHVDEEMILAAMSLIRKCYPDDRFHDRFFSFLTDTVVNKNLVVPPGFVYKISRGMPSGHPLVTLINTLVNYIVWIVILQKVYGKGNVAANAYAVFSGDDSKFYLSFNMNLLFIDYYIKLCTTLESDSVVSTLEPSFSNYWRRPDVRFLKRYVNDFGFISWHAPSMLRKLIYTDKNLNSVYLVKRWMCSILCAAPGNFKLTHLFNRYINHRFDIMSKQNTIDQNILKIDREKCLNDLGEAESVGLLSQTANKYEIDKVIKDSGKFILEDNERKSINRFIKKEKSFEREVMFLLQTALMTVGGFSEERYAVLINNFKETFANATKEQIYSLYNCEFFVRFKLNQLFPVVLNQEDVPSTYKRWSRFIASPRHNEIVDFLADFCRGVRQYKDLYPINLSFKNNLKAFLCINEIGEDSS